MDKYTDIIIDLETWSLRPDAAIRSIGAVAFNIVDLPAVGDPDAPEWFQSFYLNVSDPDGHTDPATVAWWKKQSEEAQNVLGDYQVPLSPGLSSLCEFIQKHAMPNVRVWSNGAGFDLPILRMAASRCSDMKFPWTYWNERDTRTLYWLATGYKEPEFVGAKHNAVHDAIHEAKRLQSAYRFLVKFPTPSKSPPPSPLTAFS